MMLVGNVAIGQTITPEVVGKVHNEALDYLVDNLNLTKTAADGRVTKADFEQKAKKQAIDYFSKRASEFGLTTKQVNEFVNKSFETVTSKEKTEASLKTAPAYAQKLLSILDDAAVTTKEEFYKRALDLRKSVAILKATSDDLILFDTYVQVGLNSWDYWTSDKGKSVAEKSEIITHKKNPGAAHDAIKGDIGGAVSGALAGASFAVVGALAGALIMAPLGSAWALI